MNDPPDLFAAADDARRQRLQALGWREVRGGGWADPAGIIFHEERAFAWLEREETKEDER